MDHVPLVPAATQMAELAVILVQALMKSPLPRVPRVFLGLIGHPVTLYDVDGLSQRTKAVRGRCAGVTLRAMPGGKKVPCLHIQQGKRSLLHPVMPTTIVLDGYSPLQTDVDASVGRQAAPAVYPAAQNGTLNFIGDVKPIRSFLVANLNRAFKSFDLVIAVRFEDDGAGLITRRTDFPVYPEVPSEHAVVLRIRQETGHGPGGK